MAKEISPQLKSIEDYLKLGKFTRFIIPEYQRAYSWDVNRCDKLWQDIMDAEERDDEDAYFFGTIIINANEDENGNEDAEYNLIDGQQRTTTFLLLLKALLIVINKALEKIKIDEETETLFNGLKLRRKRIIELLYKVDGDIIRDCYDADRDRELYQNATITDNRSMNELYKDELSLILQHLDFDDIESVVHKTPRKQLDNKYTNYFCNFKYFYNKASELGESQLNSFTKTFIEKCEVIEVKSWKVNQAIEMFNTLNSDGMPLCDADIISAQMYGVADKDDSGVVFLEKWEEIKKLSEKLEEGIVNIDSILTQTMYYHRTINGDTKGENGGIVIATPGLKRYYVDINRSLINNPIETSDGLIKIANIWDMVRGYSIAKVLFKFNDNSKHFLASYFYRFTPNDIEKEKTEVILECMLRLFAILEVVDAGYSSKNFKSFLFEEEIKLADKNITEEEIKKDFDGHINKNWNRVEIENAIAECEKNSLVYLNDYLFAKKNNDELEFSDQCDVEHIMPASGKNKNEIRKDAGIETLEEYYEIVNKIGNKILLESEINRGIGNEWFRTKVSQDLGNNGYNKSVYPIAKDLVKEYKKSEKPYWTKEDIVSATEKASKRIADFIFGE